MPGLGGRMSTVIKSKISRMLDRAEDPAETLDYGYQKQVEMLQNVKKGIADVVTAKKRLQMQSAKLEQSVVKLDTQARQALSQGREDLARMALERKTLAQTELLQNVKKGIADVTTSKKRLQMQSDKLEQQVVKLDTQARQALSQGREDLARAALERKTVAQTELQSLDSQVQVLERQQQQLTDHEKKLRVKIETFRTKKEVIKAQYSAAEAQVKISEAANGVGEQMADLGLAIQRAEDKTEQMKARASAVEELEAAGTFDDLTQLGEGQDDIDRQLTELTSGVQVDDELAKMKAELGEGGGDAPALEQGEEKA